MKLFSYKWASEHKIAYFCCNTLLVMVIFMICMPLVNSLLEWSLVIPSTIKDWAVLALSGIPTGIGLSFFYYYTMKKNYKKGNQQ